MRRLGLLVGGLLLLVLGNTRAGEATKPAAEKWRQVEDPHGFAIELPDGWRARVLADGSIVFSPEVESLLGPQAFVRIAHLKAPKPAAEVAKALLEAHRPHLGGLAVEGPHALKDQLADSCSMRGSCTIYGEKWSFLFVVSSAGKVATVTGFSAPAKQFEPLKPTFVRVLRGFKLDEKLRDAKRIAPPAADWTDWADPSEGAFTVRVPKGWTIEGGIIRPYIDAWGAFSAKKDGKASTALTLFSPAPPLFTEPNPTMAMAGFGEGARYNPSYGAAQDMIVRSYLGPRGYLEQILLPELLRQYPDAKLSAVRDRPELTRGLPNNPWMPVTYAAADGELTATVEKVKVRGKVYVVTTRLAMPGGGGALWYATLGLYCAPPDEFEQVEDVFWRVRDSFAVNPQWALREAREQGKRSEILAKAADEVRESITRTYETRQQVQGEISRQWSNAILGQVDLVNPETGDLHYGVPSGSNHYWEQGFSLYGTETHTRPVLGAAELQNLDDLRGAIK